MAKKLTFQCPHCPDKAFATPQGLGSHLSWAHNEKGRKNRIRKIKAGQAATKAKNGGTKNQHEKLFVENTATGLTIKTPKVQSEWVKLPSGIDYQATLTTNDPSQAIKTLRRPDCPICAATKNKVKLIADLLTRLVLELTEV